MSRRDVALSKRLAYVLRHRPDTVGLELDQGGWADVDDLVAALGVTRDQVEHVVRTNDKQRYALVGDRIRAQQGHSLPVDLGLEPVPPPDVLWHGTAATALPQVLREGLQRRARHAVHLSPDPQTAVRVGARRGRPALLRVDAARLAHAGAVFTLSGNGVWLVDEVPPAYLTVSQMPAQSSSRTGTSSTG